MIEFDRRRAPKRIESGRNPLIREVRLLEKDRGARTRSGLYLAWGLHLAREALLARAPVHSAWLGPGLDKTTEGRQLEKTLPDHCPSILRTTTRLLDSIIPGCGDQGVLLLVERPRRTTATHDGRPDPPSGEPPAGHTWGSGSGKHRVDHPYRGRTRGRRLPGSRWMCRPLLQSSGASGHGGAVPTADRLRQQ
jgi:hypothetical protein